MTDTPPLAKVDGSCDFMARPRKPRPTSDLTPHGEFSLISAKPNPSVPAPKLVTMKDIAKVAGVTSMTVSRVMTGDIYVAPATRELVLRIARELNYTTNPAGRALRTGRTGTIAVIGGALTQPYQAAMVSSIESLLNKSGYQTKLVLNQNDLGHLIRSTQAAVVDGVIITGMHDLLSRFREKGYEITQPHVHISIVPVENEDCVQCNLVPALEEALRFMVAAGRKRIAYVGIGDPEGSFTASHPELRSQIYAAEMKRAGRVAEFISAANHYDVSGAERVEILQRHFKAHGCPDAILCVNDDVAMQTYRALMDVGCRIPDDTLMVGCDGLPFTAYFEPPLSTIAQPFDVLAAEAWKFLQGRMTNPSLATQFSCFKAQLVTRRSLKP